MEISVPHRQQKTSLPAREKRTLSLQEVTRSFSNLARRSSLRRTHGRHNALSDDLSHNLIKTLAVSDGELNVLEVDDRAATQYSSSNSSLPTVPSEGSSGVGQVASWAVSFERLLEDPTGVHYFTAFLKMEVSAENILFWLECEKFRKIHAHQTEKLRREALSIYNSFLSNNATSPINIDDRVRIEEKDVLNPHPDIFQKAQQQIFKLMKYDSYTRFVRSQLYQGCMLANVEGRKLPELDPRGRPLHTREPTSTLIKAREKSKVKPGGAVVDDAVQRRKVNLQSMMGKDKRKDTRGSWGESASSLKSGLAKSSEMEKLVARSADVWVDKYCCVFLPDDTASLTPVRPGDTVGSALAGLCEKRGLRLSEIIIYLQGRENHLLSLDQDSSVLKDQQVILKVRVKLTVKVAFTGKMVLVVVKPEKTLREGLSELLHKHRLRPQDAIVTDSENGQIISLDSAVTSLSNKTLILTKDALQTSSSKATSTLSSQQDRRGAVDSKMFASGSPATRQKNPGLRRTYDVDGLVELLNRAQCCSADDQRGLLKKEDLMLPSFLQLPGEEGQDREKKRLRDESCSRGTDSPTVSVLDDGASECSSPARETVV